MSEQQRIDIHVQSGTGEILRIVATILLFGGAGAIAWSVAQGPNAEMAASGLSMMLVMMIRLSYGGGRIAMPTRPGTGGDDDFAVTKGVVAQVAGEYRSAIAKANMPVLVLVSALYAIGFLLLRAAVSAAMGIFSNLFVAGGAAAMVGALVVFPSLLPSILSSLKRKGVVVDPTVAPATRAAAPPAPVQPAPAPAPAPRPVAAPVAPRPVAQPVQTPAPKKVVRRVVRPSTESEK